MGLVIGGHRVSCPRLWIEPVTPCIGKQILNHWTFKGVPCHCLMGTLLSLFCRAVSSFHMAPGPALTLCLPLFWSPFPVVRRFSRRPSAASVTVPWSCPLSTFSAATPSTSTALRVTQKVTLTALPASLKTARSWI